MRFGKKYTNKWDFFYFYYFTSKPTKFVPNASNEKLTQIDFIRMSIKLTIFIYNGLYFR